MGKSFKTPEALETYRQTLLAQRDPEKPCVSICAGAGCIASGAGEVIEAFRAELDKKGLAAHVDTKGTGCPGFCERGPVVLIYPGEICYLSVKAEDVPEIVEKTLENQEVVERLLYQDPETGKAIAKEGDIPFYAHQERTLLCSNSRIDSKSFKDYLSCRRLSAIS
ncbi:MAG: (2Fe-2S) ferredoxin domain-containing protein [Desulfobacterales bacterium]|nr:(2Fe-2S) ferredoxin domain-containing protein [Desulfobacterales bacterium]